MPRPWDWLEAGDLLMTVGLCIPPEPDDDLMQVAGIGLLPMWVYVHATGRDGKARVVSVTGIGGIGKSRLGWELEKYVDGLTEAAWAVIRRRQIGYMPENNPLHPEMRVREG